MNLNSNIDKNFEIIKKISNNSSDLVIRNIEKFNFKIGYVFYESVSSDDKISNFLNKSILNIKKKNLFESLFQSIKNTIYNSKVDTCDNFDQVFYYLASGFTILLINGYDKCIILETKTKLDRGVSESSSEPIVRGPKDSFTENHNINLGLIRKRIKDKNLVFDESIVGRRTRSKVAIAYINDIVPIEKIKIIKRKLDKINIDGILDSGYVRELLEEKSSSLFPKIISTERPDLACSSLLNGKIVILVENTPYILILPAILTDFIHSPEDYYQKPFNSTFSRFLRVLCFFITSITPALYIALMTFNQEIIPDQLLISLATQREGVPFPAGIEVLIFVIIFEILREADVHSPSFSGSAMNIVGALVLGDAAVNAGIVSPIVVIIVAITSITELVFYDVDFIDALREWRIIFIIFAMILGIIGLVLGLILFITKLASIECMGTPYLIPFSPLKIKDLKDSILRFKRSKLTNRPTYLTSNSKKLGDYNEKSNY